MVVSEVLEPVCQQNFPHAPDGPSSILSRLRTETRYEHDAVERELDLMSGSLTLECYRRRLAQFYGFYAPLEQALLASWNDLPERPNQTDGSRLLPSKYLALVSRLNKSSLLSTDLHNLGIRSDSVSICRDMPQLKTQAQVMGCMYVVEGATLGGRMITQHVRAMLGITPQTGGYFFHGYGDSTGKMWKDMRQLLINSATDTMTQDIMVASATATFAGLRRWFTVTRSLKITKMTRDV